MRRGVVIGACAVLASAAVLAQADELRAADRIPLRGRLSGSHIESFRKLVMASRRPLPPRGKEAEPAAREANLILLDLQTTPGQLEVALTLAEELHKLREEHVETVAFIDQPGSASDTLLALACGRFYMASGARLEPIDPAAFDSPSSDDARRKLSEAVQRYAASRPTQKAFYHALVDPSLEVYALFWKGSESEAEFVPASQYEGLDAAQRARLVGWQQVSKAGTPPRLTAAQADWLKVSRGTKKDAHEVAEALRLPLRDLERLEPEAAPSVEKPVPAAQKPEAGPRPARIQAGPGSIVVIIPLDEMVGEGMLYSLNRRLAKARKLDPALIVLEINTFGGYLGQAIDIANVLFTLDRPTVAYVNPKAISAGALIAVACGEIVMQAGSTVGDCAPVDQSGEMAKSEKIDTFLRAEFRKFCKNKYPAALGEAMVTIGTEVYEIETLDGKLEYVTGKDYDNLKRSRDRFRYRSFENARKIVKGDELLTMTDEEALKYGFSRATVKSRHEVLALYGVADRRVVVLPWTWSEKLVQFLDAVGPFLLGLGVLAIMLELQTQATHGLLAIVGGALVATFFLRKYAAGLAEVWEIGLFVIGVVLLAVEIFVTPGFGVLGIAGILAMLTSIVLSFQSFVVPVSREQWADFSWSMSQAGLVALTVFVGMVLVGRYLHRVPYLGKMVLQAPSVAPSQAEASVLASPSPEEEQQRVAALVGRRGRAVSMLRPAGRAEFDGEPLDVVTLGDLINPGEAIEITEVQGNRVVVRRVS